VSKPNKQMHQKRWAAVFFLADTVTSEEHVASVSTVEE
jgi:hypothetical protein